jgi:hypothetical protein
MVGTVSLAAVACIPDDAAGMRQRRVERGPPAHCKAIHRIACPRESLPSILPRFSRISLEDWQWRYGFPWVWSFDRDAAGATKRSAAFSFVR